MKKIIWLTLPVIGIYVILISTSNNDFLSKNSAKESSLEVVQIGKMTTDRAAHQATLLKNGKVFITGGCAEQGCSKILSSAELYDPASQSFRPVSSMITPRASHIAVALSDERVLVAGGWTGNQATNSAEIYDPTTDQWKIVDTMSNARASLISVLLPDSTVLIMGGGSGRLGDLTTIEIFDPTTGIFSIVGSNPLNHYLATALADGRVLMTGGQDKEDEIHGRATIFDPNTGKMQETSSMEIPRVKHAAALLPDDRILVIGGSGSEGYSQRYSSTEIYDPKSDRFSAGPNMRFGRHKIRDAVAVLPSGEVLIAGGADRLEIFNPLDQMFRIVEGQLSGPLMFATATLLQNSDVLVLGGYDERTQTSASAWLVQSEN